MLAGGAISDPEVSFSIKSQTPQKGGITFSIKLETKKGELTFLKQTRGGARD